MKQIAGVVLLACLFISPALSNDTSATLGAGGLEFVQNDNIRMVTEDLFLSMDEVRVVYEFENITDEDQEVFIAFPLPDIQNDWYGMIGYPTENAENIFAFETLFNGQSVASTLHRSIFAMGVDRTKELTHAGLPFAPHLMSTGEAINALDETTKRALIDVGVIIPEPIYDADDPERHYTANWILKSAYTWTGVFPSNERVRVEHRYTPGLGGTAGVTFLYEGEGSTRADYDKQFCIDAPFVNAVRNTLPNADELWGAPFYEARLEYILSTGNNWYGPLERFRLVVDKGSVDNLVSFCGEGVRKIDATTFEMVAEDFYPWEDIEVLFLVRYALNDEAAETE